jgi:hypothetical protein
MQPYQIEKDSVNDSHKQDSQEPKERHSI